MARAGELPVDRGPFRRHSSPLGLDLPQPARIRVGLVLDRVCPAAGALLCRPQLSILSGTRTGRFFPAPGSGLCIRGYSPAMAQVAAGSSLAAAAAFWLSYQTIQPEGDWWAQRARERRELVNVLLDIDRQVPEHGTAYFFGFSEREFAMLENGGVLKVYHLLGAQVPVSAPRT